MTNGQLVSQSVNPAESSVKMTTGQYDTPASLAGSQPSSESDTASVSKPLPISDTEARLLLQEETRKTQQTLHDQEQKSKKLLKIVIVIAVILCLAGLIFALVMQSYQTK